MKYLFVFKSRTSAFSFLTALKKANVGAEIVSTPAIKGGGCGLSVKVGDLSKAKKVFSLGDYRSLVGIYAQKQ